MEQPLFIMEPNKKGLLRYFAAALIPVIIVGIVIGLDAAGWLACFLVPVLLLPREHWIEVYPSRLVDKNRKGFINRIVYVNQIADTRIDLFGATILVGLQNKDLLCIETGMSNRHCFEQWLIKHNINKGVNI